MMAHLFLACLSVLIMTAGCAEHSREIGPPADPSVHDRAPSPEAAAYWIGGQTVTLIDPEDSGEQAAEILTGPRAARAGDAIAGDLDDDGTRDTILLLQPTDGGEKAIYLAAALHSNGEWQGTNGILISQRAESVELTVRNGLIRTRAPDQPDEKPRYFVAEQGLLREVLQERQDQVPQEGWVTFGHKVHEIRLCGEKRSRWLLSDSRAYDGIQAHYRQTAAGLPPYGPVFMILAGRKTQVPARSEPGFELGFQASELVRLAPRGHCHADQIEVDAPLPGSQIKGTIAVRGRARGPWYFEGDFPLRLVDGQGKVVGEHYATAQGPWMTEDWVPFTAEIGPSQTYLPGWGWLVLRKDNPSGRRELDAEVRIPLFFSTETGN